MLEQLLPETVQVSESRVDIAGAPLFPEEEAVIARAVEKRQREFTTGRACAREALMRLGVMPRAIPSGPRGAPEWPPGTIGSITHCEGFRACAVARSSQLATIGVDAEVNAPLPDGVLPDIALSEEREQLKTLAREEPGVSWDRVLFSAKECVYKAWFPLAGRWLGFEDASISIDRDLHSFSARLLVPGPSLGDREVRGFPGRWLVQDGLVLAAISVPANFD